MFELPQVIGKIAFIAISRHTNQVKIAAIYALKQVPFEVRHLKLLLYQVNFDNWINNIFYIDAHSGDIFFVRSDIWRIYDFFWMLRIMDFQEHEYSNNPVIIAAVIVSLAFVMTGIMLLHFSILKPWCARVKYHSQD
jgi:hypothetical protein